MSTGQDEVMGKRKAPVTRPQHLRDELVKRHLEGGESIKALCKHLKISRATAYNWLEQYKAELAQSAMRVGVNPKDLEKTAKQELIAQNEILQTENRKLRDRLVSLMVKHGEIP